MKKNRLWMNIMIVVTYIASQFVVVIPMAIFASQGNSQEQAFLKTVPYYVASFVIGALLVIFFNRRIRNETDLERSRKETWLVTIAYIIGGFILALISQIIFGMVNTYILKQPVESQNTIELMNYARKAPLFIILISIVGPILEEFVFRKVLFGEIYQFVKGHRVVAFIVAWVVSGMIFSAAHADFNHTLIYLGMSLVFSLLYVASKRIIVPIAAHMLMNTFVVLMQVVFADKIEEAQKMVKPAAQFIYSYFF